MAFVHLHVHSQFSLLDGTMDPKAVVARAAEMGMPAVALTDTCNLYGAVPFYKAAKAKGIRPVVGAELHVQPEGVDHEDPARVEGGYQILVLVETQEGYTSLCALITDAIFLGTSYKPRVDLALLEKYRAGLIVLTGGRKGAFGRSVLADKSDEGRERVQALHRVFDREHLYLELQDHGLEGQDRVNDAARSIAAELGLCTVVTNAVHYEKPEDSALHEVLNAISLGVSLSDHRRLISPTDQAWLKTEAEMRALFPDDPEAIDRSGEIAERCEYHFSFDDYHFPATTPPDTTPKGEPDPDTWDNWVYFYRAFPPPKGYGLPEPHEEIPPKPDGAGNMDGYFKWYTMMGLALRLEHVEEALHPKYFERVEHEFRIVLEMGFPAYFLIVAEFINWSKDNGIPVGPGRGSAAGSLIAYAQSITDIDPIRFDLLFERFLNPERVSMPDVDIDFAQDRRHEAIEHVREKYGSPLVSQIITYGKLKAKAAIRDVARVMDLYFGDADRISKLIPDDLTITIPRALEEVEALSRLYEGDPKVRRVLDVAMGIEGLCRQTGVHAAGVIIADRPLVEYAPLYRDGPDGGPVVQYEMKSAEGIGLIKFDFLGLKTLDQIRDAVINVERNHGVVLDMAHIPIDDEATFELLQNGDGLGVFQLESSGMRDLLGRLRPSCLDDLVALVALYRPGPLSSGMVDDFVDRKHGRQEVSYPLPMLEPILESTYGTIVYQEQVMKIAQVMANYSLGEADLLRRAMGKKKAEEMEKQKSRFLSGAAENDLDPVKSEAIFDLLAKFAAYGFNKSHSAAYGYVSYQTAYLKAHYRAEYMAALMTIEASNTDKVLIYIQDCRRAGIEVLPVCVNESELAFSVPKESALAGDAVIRFGMAAVKNVGSDSVHAILEARAEGGPFATAVDFFERVDAKRVNKRAVENLVKAGAFDFSGFTRARLCASIESVVSYGSRRQADRAAGQGMLFGGFGGAPKRQDFRFADCDPWPRSEELEAERGVLGLYLSGHPMEALEADVMRFANCGIGELVEIPEEARQGETRVIGIPGEIKTIKTKRGDKMAFVVLEDARAAVECVFFADPWQRSQAALKAGGAVLVSGRVEGDGDAVKLLAKTAEPIDDVRSRAYNRIQLKLALAELDGDRVDRLKALLEDEQGGCATHLVVSDPGRYAASFQLPEHPVRPTTRLEERIGALFGRSDVVVMH